MALLRLVIRIAVFTYLGLMLWHRSPTLFAHLEVSSLADVVGGGGLGSAW